MEFKLKDGTVIQFENDYITDDANLRKFRCTRSDGGPERPWIWIHQNDIPSVVEGKGDGEIILGIAANQCLNGFPWGSMVPVRNKRDMLECDMDELIDFDGDVMLYIPLYEASAQSMIDEGKPITEYAMGSVSSVLGEDHELYVKLKELGTTE